MHHNSLYSLEQYRALEVLDVDYIEGDILHLLPSMSADNLQDRCARSPSTEFVTLVLPTLIMSERYLQTFLRSSLGAAGRGDLVQNAALPFPPRDQTLSEQQFRSWLKPDLFNLGYK